MRATLVLTMWTVGAVLAAVPDPDLGVPDPVIAPSIPAIRPLTGLPRTYEEARARSMATGKVMVVWTGDAICIPCVRANAEEFVMFTAASHPLFPDHTLTVAVPDGDSLMMAGQVARWERGHIPTVREVLRQWQVTRQTVRDVGRGP